MAYFDNFVQKIQENMYIHSPSLQSVDMFQN